MTIGAGIQLYEMNNALAKIGRAATGGFARSVGAAGGFIHGGGHGPLGPLYGQSTDSALEFEIVTADVGYMHRTPTVFLTDKPTRAD